MATRVEKNKLPKHAEVDVQEKHHNGHEQHEDHNYSSETSHDKTKTHKPVKGERKASMKNTLKSNLAGLALIVAVVTVSGGAAYGDVQVNKSVLEVPVVSVDCDVEGVDRVSDIGVSLGVVAAAKVNVVRDLADVKNGAYADVAVEAQYVPVAGVSKMVKVASDRVVASIVDVDRSVNVGNRVAVSYVEV